MNRKQDNLNDALRDIATAPILKPEFELRPSSNHESLKAGPNSWDNLTAADWGPEHDFELYDHGSIWIFYPVSNAALQWCYKRLPEDCPRWGAKGYAIEARYIGDIVEGARRDQLISEQDWHDANCEADDIARQWEGQ